MEKVKQENRMLWLQAKQSLDEKGCSEQSESQYVCHLPSAVWHLVKTEVNF